MNRTVSTLALILISGFVHATEFTALDGATVDVDLSVDNPAWPPAKKASLERWQNLRFGIFIHWGPTVLAVPKGGWFARDTTIPAAEYDKLYLKFNPVRFDADEWVRIAQDAGMRYMVLIAKHQDGFCMWNTMEWVNPAEYAFWNLDVPAAGAYAVQIEYGCNVGRDNSRFAVELGDSRLEFKSLSTGHRATFKTFDLGTMNIAKAGKMQLRLRLVKDAGTPIKNPHDTVLNLRRIVLVGPSNGSK